MQHNSHGHLFRVLTKEFSHDVILRQENGRKVWTGLYLQVLQAASQTLNFTYDLIDGSGLQWGTGTAEDAHVGFYGMVINQEVDIGLATTDHTYERALMMDVVDPVLYSSWVMVYRRPSSQRVVNMPLGPLSSCVLFALALAMVSVMTAIFLLEVLAGCWGQGGQSVTLGRTVSTLDRTLHLVVAALLQEASPVKLRSAAARVLLSSWWLLSLVMAAAYSGSLTAFLSASRQPLLFSTPENLLTKAHSYTWGTVGNSSFTMFLKTSNSSVLRNLRVAMDNFATADPRVLSVHMGVHVHKVLTERYVAFLPENFVWARLAGRCDVDVVDPKIAVSLASFVLSKKSPLTRPVSDVILRLHSSGLLSKWTDQWYPHAACPPSPGPLVISMPHVQGVLLVLPAGAGLSFIVVMVEVVYNRTYRKRQ